MVKTYNELAFKNLALNRHAIVGIVNIAGDITYVNDKLCATSGYDREELLGKNFNIIRANTHLDEFFSNVWKTISSGDTWHGEIKNTSKTGNYYWTETTIIPILDDTQKPFRYLGIHVEITEQKKNEEKIKDIAYQCMPTDLLNHASLADRLSRDILQRQHQSQSLAVAFLELADVKAVNESYGYMVEDDQSFVRDMLENTDDLAIIEGVIALGKAFEGDETMDHRSVLLKLNCHLVQNYDTTQSVSGVDVPQWISNWKADDVWTNFL